MAIFISTIRFTEQGMKAIDLTTKRASAFKSAAKKTGCKVKEIYWTLWENDGVMIFDAPDDETAATLLLQVGSQGNVQTTTCRAFTASEIDGMQAKVTEGK